MKRRGNRDSHRVNNISLDDDLQEGGDRVAQLEDQIEKISDEKRVVEKTSKQRLRGLQDAVASIPQE